MSKQDSQEANALPYGEVPDMQEMAIQTTIEGLKAKFKRQKKRHLRSDEEYRELAERQMASSVENGQDNHLGTAAPLH